jgi:predicted outer membrane lipoprotein
MYSQLWNNINRHLTVIWQSVGVLASAFAILSLVEKQIVTLDCAAAVVVLISGWLIAHTYDASNWFNRNQAIISNIERQFLRKSDTAEIHCYFEKYRKVGAMLHHLRIQQMFGLGIGAIMLAYHFWTQVVPGIGAPWSTFSFPKCLPYLTLLACAFGVLYIRRKAREDETELSTKSPGKPVC